MPVASLLERAGEAEYFGIATLLANTFSLCSLSSSRQPQLAAALLFGPVRCLTWACYFQFLSTESRYPPGLSARAMGYNNVVIAIVGAAGPYTAQKHLISRSPATPSDGGGSMYVPFFNCSIFAYLPSVVNRDLNF